MFVPFYLVSPVTTLKLHYNLIFYGKILLELVLTIPDDSEIGELW